jgi:hypothetical protein
MLAAASLHASSVLPLALGGEAAVESGNTGTAIAVVSAVSIVAGYVLLWALWHFVFSTKAKAKRGEPPEH